MSDSKWENNRKIKTGSILVEFLNKYYLKELSNYKVSGKRLKNLSQILIETLNENNRLQQQLALKDKEWIEFYVSSSLSQKKLRSNLGTKYKEIIKLLFEVSKGFSKKNKVTKAYKLRISTIINLSKYFQDTIETPINWKDGNDRLIKNLKDGIIKTTKSKTRIVSNIKLDGEVTVNLKTIKESLLALCNILQLQESSIRDEEVLRKYSIPSNMKLTIGGNEYYLKIAFMLYQIYRLSIQKGKFPQIYHEADNGRLYGIGFNLQSCMKRARIISFMNLNLYDFDINSAHPTIFYSLSKRLKIKAPKLFEYINNKQRIRNIISNKINCSVDKVKEAINSLFYGAKLNFNNKSIYKTAIQKTLRGSAEDFRNDKFIKEFGIEISEIINKILKDKTITKIVRGKTIENVLSKSIPYYILENGKKKKEKESSILSHIITGYEVLIIQTAMKILKKRKCKVSLLIHDGFIGEDTDEKSLAREVKNKLNNVLPNLKLTFEKKKI